jgi:allantoin racemase
MAMPQPGRIAVINPNSTQAVTDGISAALQPLRFSDGPVIDCLTLAEGPPGIENQRHVDGVIIPLCELIKREDNAADAFVIACFSDPGMASARECTDKPVFGISESGILSALTLGDRFGVIAILPASVTRHRRYIRQMGLQDRFAADIPIGIGVTALKGDAVLQRMQTVGREMIDRHGADVLVLGCAGMAHARRQLEDSLDVPVVEPCQAATAQALASVRLEYRQN